MKWHKDKQHLLIYDVNILEFTNCKSVFRKKYTGSGELTVESFK